jgi:hypothetical protein
MHIHVDRRHIRGEREKGTCSFTQLCAFTGNDILIGKTSIWENSPRYIPLGKTHKGISHHIKAEQKTEVLEWYKKRACNVHPPLQSKKSLVRHEPRHAVLELVPCPVEDTVNSNFGAQVGTEVPLAFRRAHVFPGGGQRVDSRTKVFDCRQQNSLVLVSTGDVCRSQQ